MAKTNSKTHKKNALIYIIAGKEPSLISAEAEKLIDELLSPQQKTTGLLNAEPDKVYITEILDELRTIPFLTDKRVVLVKEADKFISENRELLEKYFDAPSPTGILVLTVNTWQSNTKLAKKLPKVGKLISITQPKPWQLPGRLAQYAADAHDKKLNRQAAELLIELTGDNLFRLYGEIDKLALFADKEKSITTAHIEALIGHNRLFNAFAVIDAIITRNAAEATNRLRNMFAEDKSTGFTIVGAFAFHFRRLFNAKVLLEKGLRTDEIAKKLRIWSNRDALFAQLKKTSLKQIGDNLQQLAATDYAIKTGRTKPHIAIEQLVLKLATA
jgi:DNA polymerase-3 subunit delta